MAATHAAAFAGTRAWSKAEFAGLLQGQGCFATGDAHCFALARVVLDEVELLTIATHPTFRRRGLGLVCMKDWQGVASKRGATRAFLEVAADNQAAIALYRACGFAHSGTRPGYYRRDDGTKCDALMMVRPLN